MTSGRAAARALAALLATAAVTAPAFAAPAEEPAVSDRSRELVRLDCASALARRELTLFANGTLRLKAGEPGAEAMSLAELAPEEVDDAVALLAEIDFSETDAATSGPDGALVDRCTLELALPGRERVERRFKRFDSQSLALARALAIVDGLATRVEEPRAVPGAGRGTPAERGPARLPVGYEPAVGDVLRHAHGPLYEVVTFTADDAGVELHGVDQPLTLYLPRGRLGEEFVELVRRREP